MTGDLTSTPLLTPSDLARFFQVKRSTIYDWVKAKRVPAIRVGRHLRFDPATVAALCERGVVA